jgi:hypothetical protein
MLLPSIPESNLRALVSTATKGRPGKIQPIIGAPWTRQIGNPVGHCASGNEQRSGWLDCDAKEVLVGE